MLAWEPLLRPGDAVEVAEAAGLTAEDLVRAPGSSGSSTEGVRWVAATVVAAVPRVTLRGEVGAALVLRPAANRNGTRGGGVRGAAWVHVPSRAWPEGDQPLRWAWRPTKRLRDDALPARKQRRRLARERADGLPDGPAEGPADGSPDGLADPAASPAATAARAPQLQPQVRFQSLKPFAAQGGGLGD
jgi:hypothetical protein